MGGLWPDVRRGAKALLATPVFTAIALTCLALGIGANTAMFSVVQAVLLRPLPFDEPGRLVQVWATYEAQGAEDVQYYLTPNQLVEVRERGTVFDDLAATRSEPMRLGEGLENERVDGARVSASLFPLLGLRPVAGRVFGPEEDQAGSRVAVISEGLWRRSFGGSPGIIGSSIVVEEELHLVVGVLPGAPTYPDGVDIWLPLAIDDMTGNDRERGSLSTIGRLEADVSLADARRDVMAVADVVERTLGGRNRGLGFGVEVLQENLVGEHRTALVALLGAVVFLFVIAIVNVTNLLLVRAECDGRRLALHMALGAAPYRILRYIVAQYGMLAGAGGLLGLALAYLALPSLLALQPQELVPFGRVEIDVAVLIWTLISSLAVVLALGLLVGVRQVRTSPGTVLQEQGTRTGRGVRGRRVLSALAALEIATAFVLLAGAGLMGQSFVRIAGVSPGFTSAGALVVRVTAPSAYQATHEQRVAFFERVEERLLGEPGVQAVGAAHALPIHDILFGFGFNIEGRPPDVEGERLYAVYRLVTAGYFRAMDIPLVAGRTFEPQDRAGDAPVAVVSRELARRYWPGQDPIGRRLKRGTYDDPTEPWREVIGVVADVRDAAVTVDVQSALYLPHTQFPRPYAATMALIVRTDVEPASLGAAIREAVKSIDPNALVFGIAPMTDLMASALGQERFNAVVMSVFALLGITLAVVGIYGVVSFGVDQRRRELGLRMALGACGSSVVRLVLWGGARLAAIGVGAGIIVALPLARLMSNLLYGVPAADPATYLLVGLGLGSVTMLATWLPARRAAKLDPVQVLTG